jgi:hypothetical protein
MSISIKEVKQEMQDLIQALKGYTVAQWDQAVQVKNVPT